MSKGIVLYQSKYGATEKYAGWISKAAGFDCVETKKADVKKVGEYETIILAGGIYASGIAGLSFLKKNIGLFNDKKIAVFCVGASPYDESAFSQLCGHNFNNELKNIPCFYGRGIWNEKIMTFTDRTLCKMLQKAIAKKDPDSYEPWESALMCAVGQNCDWTDKEYLKPLLDFINS